ncbi:winged helix-turn-helix transcriptional regulator [Kitasatospora sp. NPDC002965]|uniref:winged helix-turn-helix domain-containing protein n=1 Tax=Kitasatospora sp. NPDC002965 TaxID=3154775 RepID=UPI0033BD50B3
MIMIGRTVIDRDGLAALTGWSISSLNRNAFKAITPVAGGGRGSKALYDLEQAEAHARNLRKDKQAIGSGKYVRLETLPNLPDYSTYCDEELWSVLRSWLDRAIDDGELVDLTDDQLDAMTEDELQDFVNDHELLTLEEARLAVPQDQRLTKATWQSYYAGIKAANNPDYGSVKKTRLPDPDRTFYGVDFWYRCTIEKWNTEDRKPVGGVKGQAVAAGWQERLKAAHQARQARSIERKTRVCTLYQQDHTRPVTEIADAVGVSEGTAYRYLRQVFGPAVPGREDTKSRRMAVRELVQAEPGISGSEVARRLGIGGTTANRYLNELGRENARPEDKAAERHEQAAKLLRENPDLEADELAAILALKPVTTEKYLHEARGPEQP